ncbi:MAG: hypothetical protein JJE30_11890 [Desulfuromonadales bacterium]|nr:hypothetical protein [Desulfuromonadales bacterium]
MGAHSKEIQKDLLQAMSAGIPAAITDSTVVIVGSNAPAVRHFGTGTLFSVADRNFVVTAAHVIRSAYADKATVGISGGVSDFIATPDSWILSNGLHGRNGLDLFDVAVCALNENQVAKLRSRIFLRLSDISFSDDLSQGYFLISGFPQIWSTACDQQVDTMKLRLLHFSTFSYQGDTAGLDGYDARYHLLLDAKHDDLLDKSGDKIQFRMRSGASARMPNDLQGVSGCSVWQIGDLRTPPHQWRSDQARLVAVQTSVYSKRSLIKATRWNALSTLLYTAFPELRPAIELHANL